MQRRAPALSDNEGQRKVLKIKYPGDAIGDAGTAAKRLKLSIELESSERATPTEVGTHAVASMLAALHAAAPADLPASIVNTDNNADDNRQLIVDNHQLTIDNANANTRSVLDRIDALARHASCCEYGTPPPRKVSACVCVCRWCGVLACGVLACGVW